MPHSLCAAAEGLRRNAEYARLRATRCKGLEKQIEKRLEQGYQRGLQAHLRGDVAPPLVPGLRGSVTD